MLKIVWFIPRPERDLEAAEGLYQDGHVRRGMRQENLQRFRINLALFPQPTGVQRLTGSAEPAVFRFSEGYWQDFAAIEECYRSPNGLAALADGMLNAVPRVPAGPLPVLFGEEEEFPAASRLAFDSFSGRYVADRPAKLFLFVALGSGEAAGFDREYREFAPRLADVPGLGPHVLTRFLDLHLHIGSLLRWPPPGTQTYHRAGEYYFSSIDELERFTQSAAFDALVALAKRPGREVTVVAVEPQEVFFTTVGRQPLSKGWLDFSSQQGD